jgi:hypothetical protein
MRIDQPCACPLPRPRFDYFQIGYLWAGGEGERQKTTKTSNLEPAALFSSQLATYTIQKELGVGEGSFSSE